jgi:hypothetical protein
MNVKEFFEEFSDTSKLEKKQKRNNELEKTLEKNYKKTFISSVEKAVNRKYKSDKIKKIELDCMLNILTGIRIYDYNNNLIHNKKIEDEIKEFYKMKKKANDSNSDRYFKEKKNKPNQVENLINRSLGESYFEY